MEMEACPTCGIVVYGVQALIAHTESAHGSGGGANPAGGAAAGAPSSGVDPSTTAQGAMAMEACPVCGQVFAGVAALIAHSETHSANATTAAVPATPPAPPQPAASAPPVPAAGASSGGGGGGGDDAYDVVDFSTDAGTAGAGGAGAGAGVPTGPLVTDEDAAAVESAYMAFEDAAAEFSGASGSTDAPTSGYDGPDDFAVPADTFTDSAYDNYAEVEPPAPSVTAQAILRNPPPATLASLNVRGSAPADVKVKGTDGATAVWNDEFQDVVEMAATTPQEVKNRSRSIKEIARTFADTAKPVAAGIIQERNASGGAVNVGGVAGGLKYSVKGQFFKFAVDQGLYGDDCFAAKSAGLELAALKEMVALGITGLHFPLMCTVDFLGQRLSVFSHLPIDASTIAYGSADGGKTVKGIDDIEDKQVKAGLRLAADRLNLADHIVNKATCQFAGDVEGHVGTSDARFYLLDTARTFPPTAPSLRIRVVVVPADTAKPEEVIPPTDIAPAAVMAKAKLAWGAVTKFCLQRLGQKKLSGIPVMAQRGNVVWAPDSGDTTVNARASTLAGGLMVQGDAVFVQFYGHKREFLYQLMRPEWVRANPVPISSDCFSGWGRHDAQKHNAVARDATQKLKTEGVAAAAALLDAQCDYEDAATADAVDVKALLHEAGVNLRYLGMVRQRCTSDKAKMACMVEMIARVGRQKLTAAWRLIPKATVAKGKAAAARIINQLVSSGEASDMFWAVDVKEWLQCWFEDCLTAGEAQWSYNLRASLDAVAIHRVMDRLCSLCGVVVDLARATAGGLSPSDITAIEPRVKQLEVPESGNMSLADKAALSRAIEANKHQLQQRRTLLGHNTAPVATTLERLTRLYATSEGTREHAEETFQELLAVQQMRCGGVSEEVRECLFRMGRFYTSINDHEKAMETFSQLQELEDLLYGPRSVQRARTDQEMVVCLLLTHKLEAATSLQLHVLEVLKEKLDPEDIQLAKAYAATCTTLQASGDKEKALTYIQQALDIVLTHPAYGQKHQLTAVFRNAKGQSLLLAGKAQEAKRELEAAVTISEATYGNYSQTYCTSCINLGMTLMQLEDFDGALELIQKGVVVASQRLGEENPLTGQAYHNLGLAHAKRKDWLAAVTAMNKAAEIRRKIDPDSSGLAETIASIAGIYDNCERVADALPLYCQGIDILVRNGEGLKHRTPHLLQYMQSLDGGRRQLMKLNAAAYQSAVQAGMQAAASGEFETALRAFSAALGCVPCDASTAYNAACCYARSGDEDNAITWITNAAQYGFDAFKHAQKDDDLKLIHEHAEFAKAVERMAVNKEINTAIRKMKREQAQQMLGQILPQLGLQDCRDPQRILGALMQAGVPQEQAVEVLTAAYAPEPADEPDEPATSGTNDAGGEGAAGEPDLAEMDVERMMEMMQQQLTIARNNNCTPAEIAEIEREQRGLLDRVMAAKSAAKAKQDAEREAERAAAQTAAAIASAQTAGTGQDGDISSSSTPGMAGAGGDKFGSPSGAPATTGSPGGVGSAVGGSGGAGAGAGAGSRRRKQRRASVVSLRRQAGVLEKQGEKTFLNKNPAWRSRYFVLDRGTLKYYYNEECFLRGDAPVKGNRLVMAEYGVVSNTADESMFRLVNLKEMATGRVWNLRAKSVPEGLRWVAVLVAHGATQVSEEEARGAGAPSS